MYCKWNGKENWGFLSFDNVNYVILIKDINQNKMITTPMGFEPTRAEPIGLAVQRLNHSATASTYLPIKYSV